MKNIYVRYAETVPIKDTFIVGKLFHKYNIINTVLSENMLHKINKKRELAFEYQKTKFKLFKSFHFDVSNRPAKNLN